MSFKSESNFIHIKTRDITHRCRKVSNICGGGGGGGGGGQGLEY